jgi:hypothetical protein
MTQVGSKCSLDPSPLHHDPKEYFKTRFPSSDSQDFSGFLTFRNVNYVFEERSTLMPRCPLCRISVIGAQRDGRSQFSMLSRISPESCALRRTDHQDTRCIRDVASETQPSATRQISARIRIAIGLDRRTALADDLAKLRPRSARPSIHGVLP